MDKINPDELLSMEEFDALTPKDQEDYLSLLEKAENAWTLTGKQLVADKLADEVIELVYGGAAGGGKSEWILHRSWRKSREVSGHRTLILRTKLKELKRSIIARSLMLYATHTPKEEMPVYRSADMEWRFPNGSVIEFGYCQTDEDVGQYLSAEYDMIAFDEATQFTQYQYELIRSRARSPISKMKRGARPHVIAATNPGSRGHAFFKSTFVDTTNYGETGATWLERDSDQRWRELREDLDTLTEDQKQELRYVAFVPSTVMDNPHMTKEYVNMLKTLPEKEKRRMLYGDWDLPEGMFFTEFKRKDYQNNVEVPYHVIPPFPIPDSWQKIEATDWGYAAPFCTLWLAWDPDGRCYVYREVYKTRLTPAQQANEVCSRRKVGEKISKSYADPACWAKRDTLTIADQWASAGWRNIRAKNDRIAGWLRVREYMQPMGHDGLPGVQIFSTCENLVRTIPGMMHDDTNPEDLNTTLEDHAVDAFRYGLMTRPLPALRRKTPVDWVQDHFDKMLLKNKSKKSKIEI